MDVKQELIDNDVCTAMVSELHKPLMKVANCEAATNIHRYQENIEGTIDTMAHLGGTIKNEEIYIKDEIFVTCAGSESFVEPSFLPNACEYPAGDVKQELIDNNVCSAMATELHEPPMKIDNSEPVANLHIQQENIGSTIETMAHQRVIIKNEEIHIKDETFVACAASEGEGVGEKHAELYSCSICTYKTGYKHHLTTHMRTHTGEKPYSCSTCNYKATEKQTIVNHMRIHTGEKPYSCSMCTYSAARKDTLVSHLRTHTGEKPYSCSICGYKAAEQSSLVNHMRTHTREKPFSCSNCTYKTAYKSNLTDHTRTHTGEKPYSCSICTYKSTQKSSLVRHMKTHTKAKQ